MCSFMFKNKKGDSKYDIILSIIVGIIVVGIVMFWIFQEFFTEEDIDWEVCRESLIVRNSLPEGRVVTQYYETKTMLPLKCGTRVINIDYEDVQEAEKEIGQAVSECWYMVGRGEYEVFPYSGATLGRTETPCMVCSRISLDADVKDYYTENKISIRNAFNTRLEGYDVTVWDYLNPERGSQAAPYFGGWNDSGFYVNYSSANAYIFGLSFLSSGGRGEGFNPWSDEIFYFPTYMDPEKGDFFIVYGEPTKELSTEEGERIPPYMAFLQYADFDKLSWPWSYYSSTVDAFIDVRDSFNSESNVIRVCSSIETAPA